MTQLPKLVRLDGLKYDVSHTADSNINGRISFDQLKIQVNEDLPGPIQSVTLWHEILHGLIRHSSMKVKNEEALVEMLGYGIAQVVRDNPDLIDFTRQFP